jgi:hypothetical protein
MTTTTTTTTTAKAAQKSVKAARKWGSNDTAADLRALELHVVTGGQGAMVHVHAGVEARSATAERGSVVGV